MTRGRFTAEQIVKILQEQEAGAKDRSVPRAWHHEHDVYRWKAKYGGLDVSNSSNSPQETS